MAAPVVPRLLSNLGRFFGRKNVRYHNCNIFTGTDFKTCNMTIVQRSGRCFHTNNVELSKKRDDDSSSSDEEPPVQLKLAARPRDRKVERQRFNEQQRPQKKTELLFSEKVKSAAEAVGNLTNSPEKTTSDLLQRLRDHGKENVVNDTSVGRKVNIGDLLSSMQLESETSAAVEKIKHKTEMSALGYNTSADLASHEKIFSGTRLNIFDIASMKPDCKASVTTPLFDAIRKDEMEKLSNVPPSNAFQEMIKWTKEGKMWQFPINNEQGLKDEEKVPFTEHVFLEHLIDDFPKKGPIRHFMELIIVGLSKNPYLTVQEKHAQIQWFRDYFKDKTHLVEFIESGEEKISAQ